MQRKSRSLYGLVILILVMLTGCGSNKDAQETVGGLQTFVPVATVEPTPEPTPEPTATPVPTPTPFQSMTLI